MKIWKRQRILFPLGLSLAVLLMGCGGEMTGIVEAGAKAARTRAPREHPVDGYLEEMEKLSGAVEELVEAGREFVSIGQADPENLEGMRLSVEKIRGLKEEFVNFAEEVHPPQGLEEAHEEMAQAVLDYADLIDVYCDILLASLEGEEHPDQEELAVRWEEAGTAVADAMEKVRRALSPFPAG